MTTTTAAAAVAEPTGTGTTTGTPDNASSEKSVGSASGKSSSSSRKKRSGGNHHRRVMSAVEGSRAQQIMLCGTADGGAGGADDAFAAAMHADSISEEGGLANGDTGGGGAGLDDWNCAAVTRLPTAENAPPPPPISASNTLTCSSLSSTQGGGGTLGGGTSTLEDLASPGASLSWDNGDDDGFSATGAARRSSVEDKLGASATSTFSQSSHSTGNPGGVSTPQRRTDTTRVEDTPFLSPPGERSSPGGTSPYGPTSPAVMARIFSDDVGGDDDEEVMLAPSAEDNNNDHSNDNGHHHATSSRGGGVSYEDQERRATERDEMVRSCVLELQGQMEEKFSQVLSSQRRDFDRIFALLQAEASRRDSLNSRLHAQLLLQSESMVAMELKVLRLEAKMEKRARTAAAAAGRGRAPASQQQQYNQHGGGGIMGGIDRVDEEDVPRDIPLVGGALRQGHPSSRRDSMESDDRPVVGDPSALPSRHATGGRPSPTLIGAAFVGSSGASLASGVTATSGEGFMDEEGTVEDEDDDDDDADENADADAEDEDEDEPGAIANDDSTIDAAVNETDSTPTQSSRQSQNRNRIIGLESVIQQSVNDSAMSDTGVSTRAVRPPPDTDGASSLATSVTSATLTSTVVTATTRGSAARTYTSRGDISTHGGSTHGSIHGGSTLGDEHETVTRGTVESVLTSRDGEEDTTISTRVARQENIEMVFGLSPRSGGDRSGYRGDARGDRGSNPPRSRSQSPLTVQDSVAQDSVAQDSVASASVAASSVGISSTAAVAPSRAFTSRRAAAAAAAAAAASTGDPNRPLTNRVVQFVFNPTIENFAPVEGAGDSVTIPDEIDNLSDVVDVFATSSRRWREDYEARLDAIQKKWTPDQ